MALVLSRMIRPTVVMASPVARTTTESEYSLLGGTVCVTRGVAALALRTNTATGDADPGWRSTSIAVAVIVIRPRSGALIGMRATAEKVMSRGLVVYTCVNDVSNLVGQFASPWTRMSMRPTPFGCCARAETLRPTPAGMLSPLVGANDGDLGAGDDVDATRRRIRAARRIGRDDDDAQAVERRVGSADRLQVAANRRCRASPERNAPEAGMVMSL